MSGRRTHAQVAADAVARDRADAVAYARRHVAGIDALIANGRVGAEAAALLQARLNAFIEMIEQGLHVSDSVGGAAKAGARDDG